MKMNDIDGDSDSSMDGYDPEKEKWITANKNQSLVSSLGGAMSLYLGISIIMTAELLEFVLLLVWNLYRHARRRYVCAVTPEAADPKSAGGVSQVIIKRSNGVQVSYIGDLGEYPILKKPEYSRTPQLSAQGRRQRPSSFRLCEGAVQGAAVAPRRVRPCEGAAQGAAVAPP